MVEIIKANASHSKLIVDIGTQAFRESHGHSASKADIETYISRTYNKEAILEEFNNEKVCYHLISCDGVIAGFSKIQLDTTNKNIADLKITKLDRIYLLEAFHGKQVGAKLFQFTIELSKKQHQNGIWLAVWTENQKAVKFYQTMGFKIVGAFDFKISETHSNPNHIMYLEY
ncbi:GNAT family N-acetyltransferase [Winogradskyella sp. F6397]|uniref:GNAT family N-acetyltransferase n=1 Tax=Winogradskyella marina TaxID=2785530 RepID=A0ABS0EHT2_9FLAO|nr:GNAT family N-acetyltransferase [Winogradskyella marina]MBF8150008.1 GNAT family N-acetyltransferase [Winogradskyella marina]